jgi:hypothetical protein
MSQPGERASDGVPTVSAAEVAPTERGGPDAEPKRRRSSPQPLAPMPIRRSRRRPASVLGVPVAAYTAHLPRPPARLASGTVGPDAVDPVTAAAHAAKARDGRRGRPRRVRAVLVVAAVILAIGAVAAHFVAERGAARQLSSSGAPRPSSSSSSTAAD